MRRSELLLPTTVANELSAPSYSSSVTVRTLAQSSSELAETVALEVQSIGTIAILHIFPVRVLLQLPLDTFLEYKEGYVVLGLLLGRHQYRVREI